MHRQDWEYSTDEPSDPHNTSKPTSVATKTHDAERRDVDNG
jgi:hypothetical protein